MTREIFDEKRSQEYLFLQKVDSKYRGSLQRMIVEYDLKHSPLKILKEFYNDREKMTEALKKMILNREIFLIKVTDEIKSSY
jgi:hypothetical protein